MGIKSGSTHGYAALASDGEKKMATRIAISMRLLSGLLALKSYQTRPAPFYFYFYFER